MKRILISLVVSFSAISLMAQGMGPQAGSKSIALKFGRGVDYSDISYSQINNLSTSSTLSTPYTLADSNYGNNDVTNIIGIEAKYFVASNIAVSVSGSGVISNSPAQDLVEGYNNGDVAGSDIPTYNHVTGRSTRITSYNVCYTKLLRLQRIWWMLSSKNMAHKNKLFLKMVTIHDY